MPQAVIAQVMVPRSGLIVDAMPLNAIGKMAKPTLGKLMVTQKSLNGTYGIL